MLIDRRHFLHSAAGAAVAAAVRNSAGAAPAQETSAILAALAPLNGRGETDPGLVRDYLEYLREGGVDGVLANGTTGEFSAFSAAERKKNLEIFLRHKGSLSVMCHVGANNAAETLDLLEHATAAGADSALVLPPYYFNQPPDGGLDDFFRPLLQKAKIPVLLYNIPQLSEVEITLELVRRLSDEPRLAGVKDSWGKWERTHEYITQFPSLRVYTGASGLLSRALQAGGAGALTGNGNLFPKETAAVVAAHRKGAGLATPQAALDARTALIRGLPTIPAMKFALAQMGVAEMRLRPPLVELSAEQKSTLLRRFQEAGILS